MKLHLADAIVPIKMLKIGTVVYFLNDNKDPQLENSFPCHIAGFIKGALDNEIVVRILVNGIERNVHPSWLLYGTD